MGIAFPQIAFLRIQLRGSIRGAFRIGLLLGVALVSQGFSSSGSEEIESGLAPLKAAFIYNFLQFVEFQGTDSASWTVCVSGVSGDARRAFEALSGRSVGARTIRVMIDPAKGESCQVHFNSGEGTRDIGRPGVLTVGDSSSFLAAGGIIQFKVVNNKLRFAVNLVAARAAGIDLRSKLVALAEEVRQ